MRQVLLRILRGADDISSAMLTSRIRTSCKAAFTSKVHHRGVNLMDQLRHALVFERVGRIARRMIIRVAVERRVGEHHSGITKSPEIAMIREVDTWDGAGRVGR